MADETKQTGQTVGIYFSASTLEAGRAFAAEREMKFSSLVDKALRNELEREGALPEQRDEREVIIRGIEEEFTLEELRELLRGRQGEKARGAA